MKILIIEDEESIRQVLKDLLEINGYAVLAAADGIEGMRLVAEMPDFILCDINMPGMDGYQVIAEIQKLQQGRDIPFIFLTALADRSAQRRGMAMGADDYITKPFTERDILDAIEARVKRQRSLRSRIEHLMDQHRREISADWSHELMTPLNGVLGGLQLIEAEGGSISPAELKDVLGLIREGAERQQRLSRKLIRFYELERMKQSSSPPGLYRCQAKPAVETATAKIAKREGRECDLRVCCEAGEVGLPADLLTDTVVELVENAFRFSVKGRPVRVNGRRVEQNYRIEIIDEGPGMTEVQIGSVGAFTQFDRRYQAQQGLGLGIAIAKGVAEIAGGRLSLGSGPGGRGLLAVIELPLVS
ncbi:MAG: response regulator [Opitutaceae bacterium]|jgi:CheY-like chemotaxis protein